MKDIKYSRRNISITNRRVNDAFDEVGKGNVSRFIEKCVLFYIEESKKEYITEDQVKLIMFEYLKEIPIYSGDMTNKNYVNEVNNLKNIIETTVDNVLNL